VNATSRASGIDWALLEAEVEHPAELVHVVLRQGEDEPERDARLAHELHPALHPRERAGTAHAVVRLGRAVEADRQQVEPLRDGCEAPLRGHRPIRGDRSEHPEPLGGPEQGGQVAVQQRLAARHAHHLVALFPGVAQHGAQHVDREGLAPLRA
jgi:hypothetical protein